MVDEFSSFARMPKPMLEAADLLETLKHSVFLMDVGNPDIEITLDAPDSGLVTEFDHRLLSQAFTNLIKNATESIGAVPTGTAGQGKITVKATSDSATQKLIITIQDNGIGLPVSERHLLLEPYMTTREKGTGLGLAIVRKIMEDHGGTIELLDATTDENGRRGAVVRLKLPLIPLPTIDSPEDKASNA
jgi:two-component system nitrogen regulation sensor histidine kinase NtrY